MCKLYLTVELIILCIAVGVKRENDNRCAQQSAEALETGREIQFK